MHYLSIDVRQFRNERQGLVVSLCLSFILLVSFVCAHEDDLVYKDATETDSSEVWQDVEENNVHNEKLHPSVVFYDEVHVNKDYDSSSFASSKITPEETLKHEQQKKIFSQEKQKNINKNEKYIYLKPEKVYFDYYPYEDIKIKDFSKLSDDNIEVEVSSLDNGKYQKELVNEHRNKRDVTQTIDNIRKREIGFTSKYAAFNHRIQSQEFAKQSNYYQDRRFTDQNQITYGGFSKYPVRGNYWNALSPKIIGVNVGSRIDVDSPPIWSISSTNNGRQSNPTRRPPPPLLHNSEVDENLSEVSIIPPSQRPPVRRTTTTTPRPSPPPTESPMNDNNEPRLSNCVWAIVSCCSRNDRRVRYHCFEQSGCQGAFWDLNPCADNILDKALRETERYYD